MKLRVKVYCWDGLNSRQDTFYYQWPNGAVCRVDAGEHIETFLELYERFQVPFLFY